MQGVEGGTCNDCAPKLQSLRHGVVDVAVILI